MHNFIIEIFDFIKKGLIPLLIVLFLSNPLMSLFTYFINTVLPNLDKTLLTKLVLGLFATSIILLLIFLYNYSLLKKLKKELDNKLKIKFGVKWDKDKNPFCPVCENVLSDEQEYLRQNSNQINNGIKCFKCDKIFYLYDDNNKNSTIKELQSKL